MVDSVSRSPISQGQGRNTPLAELNRNHNADVCGNDLNSGQMELNESNTGNVFFNDSLTPDSSCVHVSDSSLDTTLVAAEKSAINSPLCLESSVEQTVQSASKTSTPEVAVNKTGLLETLSHSDEKYEKQTSENLQSKQLVAIPIESRLNVNRLSNSSTADQENSKSVTPGRSQLIGSISSISSAQSKPSTSRESMKSTLEIVAAYSSLMLSPKKGASNFVQKAQETTPVKKRYRALAPKPYTSPAKTVNPYMSSSKSPRKSPRRQQLQRKARAICPKGLVVKMVISPSKKAASQIMNRVLGKTQCKILPRPPVVNRNNLQVSPSGSSSSKASTSQRVVVDETETEEEGMETASECDTGKRC